MKKILFLFIFIRVASPAFSQSFMPKSLGSVKIGEKSSYLMSSYILPAIDEKYSVKFYDVKIKKLLVKSAEFEIRKFDSATMVATYIVEGDKNLRRLKKMAKKEYGRAENRLYTDATHYGFVWDEKDMKYYKVGISFRYLENGKQAELKLIWIPKS